MRFRHFIWTDWTSALTQTRLHMHSLCTELRLVLETKPCFSLKENHMQRVMDDGKTNSSPEQFSTFAVLLFESQGEMNNVLTSHQFYI